MTVVRQLKLPVPVHIITGGLGAGKTTFLQQLLQHRPPTELWALVINEFGAVGIDEAVLQAASQDSSEVHVQQLAGGCMCCALSGVTAVAIAQMLRRVKPDRLWIEPSGLGEPATLVDILQGQHLAAALSLQPVVCVIDCKQFEVEAPAFMENRVYQDQVSMADVLVGSKADTAACDAVHRFLEWTNHLYPPKSKVFLAENGVLCSGNGFDTVQRSDCAPRTLESSRDHPLLSHGTHPDSASSSSSQETAATCLQAAAGRVRKSGPGSGVAWLSSVGGEQQPALGRAQRKEARDDRLGMSSCGWVFHPGDIFHQDRLHRFLVLAHQHAQRVKGVLRVSPKTWVSAAAGGGGQSAPKVQGPQAGEVVLQEVAYRRDSRLEVIVSLPASGRGEAGGPDRTEGGTCRGELAAIEVHSGEEHFLREGTLGCSSLDADQVAAAFAAGQQGDWEALSAIVMSLLRS